MLLKSAGNQRPAFAGQRNLPHAAIGGEVFARDQSFFYQPIDRNADRSRGEPDFWADGVDRQGSLVEEDLEDAEIGVTQAGLPDAFHGMREQGVKRLHEDE